MDCDSFSLSLQLFAVAATLKSVDYNIARTFILHNNKNNNICKMATFVDFLCLTNL